MDLTGTIRPCPVTIWIKDLIRSLESPVPSRRELLILSCSHFFTQDGTTHDTRS